MRNLIHQPKIFPTGRQTIQLEYEKRNGDYLEFELFEEKVVVFNVLSEKETEEEYNYVDIGWNALAGNFLI